MSLCSDEDDSNDKELDEELDEKLDEELEEEAIDGLGQAALFAWNECKKKLSMTAPLQAGCCP